jgi:hypothetical protein
MAENEGGHLGVPEAGLVAEVDTGFQHFTHGDGHESCSKGWVLNPARHLPPLVQEAGNTLKGLVRDWFCRRATWPAALALDYPRKGGFGKTQGF